MIPILYAIGNFVSDMPWYAMGLVPFWGSERINKKVVIMLFITFPFLRAALGGVFLACLPNWEMWDNILYIFLTFLNIAAYYLCFKIHISKLLYTMLLIITLGTSANFLAHMIVKPFLTDTGLIIVAEPAWIIAVVLVNVCFLPFVYRTLKYRLRHAFAELSTKSILSMCIIPAMFYVVFYIYLSVLGAFADALVSFLIAFSGVASSYTTLRVVMSTAKYEQTKKETAAENVALERLNILKTDLMRTISHETLTPLAVMMGYSEITARDARKSGQGLEFVENLDTIAAEAKRIAEMIEEMRQLTLAREYSKDTHLVDIKKVITKIAGLYTKVLERKGTTLKLDIAGGLPLVLGNESEFTQVIFNLLRNADTHTENGTVTICAEQRADNIRVTVSDTGCGIPQELLPRVFERGVHGDNEGSGFGLAICRDIIEAYGGEILIESEQGKGTAVTFELPLYKEGV